MEADIDVLKDRFVLLSRVASPVPTDTQPILTPLDSIRFLMFNFYGTLFTSSVRDIGGDVTTDDISLFLLALTACGLPAGPAAGKEGLNTFGDTIEKHRQKLLEDGFDYPEPAIERVWLEVLKSLHQKGLIGRVPDLKLARRLSVEFEARMNPVWPQPGLPELLTEFRGKNLSLGIISNAQFYTPIAFEALTKQSLEEAGFHSDLLHWSFEVKVKKPSLKFYEAFLQKLKQAFPDAEPSEILCVGNDMLNDIYPAQALGMKTALYAGDKRSLQWRQEDERCKHIRPDLVLTDLWQLTECL